MIAWLRSVFFNIFLIVWTILVATFFFPIIWMKPRIVANVSYVWATGTMAAMRVILGIKVVYKGEGYLPEEPFILACKHQSAIDTIAFLTYLKYPVYILKKELVYIPFFGWYLPAMGMVAINRKAGASALKDMVRTDRVWMFVRGFGLSFSVSMLMLLPQVFVQLRHKSFE